MDLDGDNGLSLFRALFSSASASLDNNLNNFLLTDSIPSGEYLMLLRASDAWPKKGGPCFEKSEYFFPAEDEGEGFGVDRRGLSLNAGESLGSPSEPLLSWSEGGVTRICGFVSFCWPDSTWLDKDSWPSDSEEPDFRFPLDPLGLEDDVPWARVLWPDAASDIIIVFYGR